MSLVRDPGIYVESCSPFFPSSASTRPRPPPSPAHSPLALPLPFLRPPAPPLRKLARVPPVTCLVLPAVASLFGTAAASAEGQIEDSADDAGLFLLNLSNEVAILLLVAVAVALMGIVGAAYWFSIRLKKRKRRDDGSDSTKDGSAEDSQGSMPHGTELLQTPPPPKRRVVAPIDVSSPNSSNHGRHSEDVDVPLPEDRPGYYKIIVDYTAVGESRALGEVMAELDLGAVVEVEEVCPCDDGKRLRGRLKHPIGWISIKSLEPGDDRRWAERYPDPPTHPRGPAGEPLYTMFPGSSRGSPVASSPASSRPAMPAGTPMSFQGGPVSMARPLPAPQAGPGAYGFRMPPLPGDFLPGEEVVSLVDFSGTAGAVTNGEVGIVRGACKGYDGASAQARVNCKFPRHPNINFKISQIARANEVEDF
eukprot:CAMPEP_0206532570 /NCGR_PEP_ID=MMETSP0325_2-20121206/4464_1 /ASSEMBLY_ACC=CAM_ASM_000347 /TAXON_ID=2866 /ORGANISM="Crypthecodinium cohnii, Strain Seligo" /LENGTH=420 /DNA_ID=CAMNT_0054029079 /DNA_START=70 /DNA_END=1332 /DNA_ORIENTATION=+